MPSSSFLPFALPFGRRGVSPSRHPGVSQSRRPFLDFCLLPFAVCLLPFPSRPLAVAASIRLSSQKEQRRPQYYFLPNKANPKIGHLPRILLQPKGLRRGAGSQTPPSDSFRCFVSRSPGQAWAAMSAPAATILGTIYRSKATMHPTAEPGRIPQRAAALPRGRPRRRRHWPPF